MEILNDKYKLSNVKLGSGSFSDVFLGTDISTGDNVAIKIISLEKNKHILDKVFSEIEIMKKMNHINIVKYYDFFKGKDNWYIVMEYCDRGKLKDALIYLRKIGYIHRDIKPMNVLLSIGKSSQNSDKSFDYDRNFVLKLSDFGLAKNYSNSENMMETICGSPLYMAPELLIDMKYNDRADLWSFGVVMYELLFGSLPNMASNILQLKSNLLNKNIDFHLNKDFTTDCFDLLTKLLQKDPKMRIDWDNFLVHKWFTYNDFDKKMDPIAIPLKKTFSNLTRMILDNKPSSYPPNYKGINDIFNSNFSTSLPTKYSSNNCELNLNESPSFYNFNYYHRRESFTPKLNEQQLNPLIQSLDKSNPLLSECRYNKNISITSSTSINQSKSNPIPIKRS